MEILVSLLSDVKFLATALVLLLQIYVLVWCAWQLRSPQVPPPPKNISSAPPPVFSAPAAAPPPSSTITDVSVIYSVLEERFNEFSRRIQSLEGQRGSDAALEPVARKMQEIEGEITRLRNFIAQTPAPSAGGQDMSVLTEKVAVLQKMIESLGVEPEAPKPL